MFNYVWLVLGLFLYGLLCIVCLCFWFCLICLVYLVALICDEFGFGFACWCLNRYLWVVLFGKYFG